MLEPRVLPDIVACTAVVQSPDVLARWWLQNANTSRAPDAGIVIPISHFSSRWHPGDGPAANDGAWLAQPPSLSFAANSDDGGRGGSGAAAPPADQTLAATALASIRKGVTRVPVTAVTPPRPTSATLASTDAQAAIVQQQAAPDGEAYASRVARSAARVAEIAGAAGNSTAGLMWSSALGSAFQNGGAAVVNGASGAVGLADDAVTGAGVQAAQDMSTLRDGLTAAVTPIANATVATAAAARQALTQGIGERLFTPVAVQSHASVKQDTATHAKQSACMHAAPKGGLTLDVGVGMQRTQRSSLRRCWRPCGREARRRR